MFNKTNIFTVRASFVLLIVITLLLSIPAEVVYSAPSTPEEIEAAMIAEALHSVVGAAKRYLTKTGTEAASINQLVAAQLLINPDKRLSLEVNDTLQVWGDGTGAYVWWEEKVSPEVCKILNPGGTLPTAPPGAPDPGKSFQCILSGDYFIFEPVYVHNKTEQLPK